MHATSPAWVNFQRDTWVGFQSDTTPPAGTKVPTVPGTHGLRSKFPAGIRTCTDCGEAKAVDAFVPIRACKDGWYGRCRACRARRARERYQSDPIEREIQKAFESAWDAFASQKFPSFGITPAWPAVDVTEDEKAVTIHADVPGIDARNIKGDLIAEVAVVGPLHGLFGDGLHDG